MTYTPAYYLDYMERCGLTKAKDLYAYITVIRDVAAGGRLEKLASAVKARVPGLTVRPADMKQFQQELEAVKEIYNSAWSHNWGFVPMTDEETRVHGEKAQTAHRAGTADHGRGEREAGSVLHGSS